MAAGPASAQVIAAPLPATALQSAGEGLIFSQYDNSERRYRLVEWSNGVVRAFAVRPRAVPFDVDVGPDARGRQTAVYSRCAVEPRRFGPGVALAYFRSGRGCRVYALDLGTGRERRVAGLDAAGSSFLPSIWRSRIAWAQVTGSTLRLRIKEGRHRPRTVRGGTPSADLGDVPAAGPVSIDLRGLRMALTWSYYDPRHGCGVEPKAGPVPVSEAWLYRLHESRRLLVHAGCREDEGRTNVRWSSLTASGVSYVYSVAEATDARGPEVLRTIAFGGAGARSTLLSTPNTIDFVVSFALLSSGRVAYAWDGDESGLALFP
jgi:hypothetical protein